MLRRQRQVRVQVRKLLDAALFTVGFWLAHLLRSHYDLNLLWELQPIRPFQEYAWLAVVIFPVVPMLLEWQGFYDRPLVAPRRRTLWQLFWASVWAGVVVVLASFLTREAPARAVIVLFCGISFVLVWVKEEILRRWAESTFGQEQLLRRVLLLGSAEDRAPIRNHLGDLRREGIQVVAEVDLRDTPIEQVVDILHEHSVNGVILTARHTYFGEVERVIQACELEGVEVWLLADFFRTQISQTTLDELRGRPMLVFRSTPEASWQALVKQGVDLVGAFVLLVMFSPVLLGVALAIRLTSPGPVLFRQQRSGLNGKPFTMLKFRSMVTDAEQRKQELAAFNEMSGPVFKVTHDPRVTRTGRFLRKYSLDEFPQLINVLRGQMSLVGPRPLPVDEVRRFDDLAHRRRLSVKPGLTCLWQVSGRNEVRDFRDWVRLDLEYIDNWSIWLDLKILLRTIPVVLLGTGAK